ncbi:MAG TPA: methyltransferase domain-containing protein [Methylomusa anaerophila]|uniref:Teichoic acids export ATP-binding protein TagH n=1 Tax=Methylomusa anaerophila TaxID=1930071 RepID=A0A348AKN6_9FIRM|nr:ATP-binding cassette domain-containing protein [Methylomusa anaerophila]BBB91634.1 teichoic acids export ATP-binding protein TagH [Methylomusa anaerophila]HML89428.1 methyltransferase domain-containing protein [Methylomusa anaerophila]
MNNQQSVLVLDSVGKRYSLYDNPRDRLKDLLFSSLGKSWKSYGREFWALRDVSLQVGRGETLGIIGRNGSGKSTLLQLIAGIIKPTEGQIRVRGKVAALLELGSGFNPEFTGRENIFLNGALLNMSRRQMAARMDDIVSFADIGHFIDQPVKFYSSGMFVRLAFAVATSIDADLLLVDEALAVGDVFFRQKCYRRLEELRRRGMAVILVSHAMTEVQEFCRRTLLLHYSKQEFLGETLEAVNRYYLLAAEGEGAADTADDSLAAAGGEGHEIHQALNTRPMEPAAIAWPENGFLDMSQVSGIITNGEAECTAIAICDEFGRACRLFTQGQTAHIFYEFKALAGLEIPVAGITIRNDKNIIVHGKNTLQYDTPVPANIAQGQRVRFHHELQLCLAAGEYTLEIGFCSMRTADYARRSAMSSVQLGNAVSRSCVVGNAGVFAVSIKTGRKPVELTHHGICDLPGNCRLTALPAAGDGAALVYPETANTQEDLYDIAYRWGWETPALRELVHLCYKTPDFADNARRYYQSAEFQAAIAFLTDLKKAPAPAIHVLDFGCGNGIASYALARAGYTVTGIDSSQGEIAGLLAAAQLQGLDQVQFSLQHSQTEKLAFPDRSFHIVWMREVLHHIHDLSGFLAETARVLKDDGIVCCFREHVIWNEEQRRDFFATHPFYPITKDEGCYYLQDYLQAFAAAGFVMEKVLDPVSSVINTYPGPCQPNAVFDREKAQARSTGNDLFSFFARKPGRWP